jgi:hypothetical protein
VRDRFSIIGFTEAELGFIVAILLFAAMSAHRTAVAKPVPKLTPAVSRKDFENLKQQFSQLARSNAQEIQKNLELQRELDRQSNLRSRQKPSCTERHIAQGFVAEIQVTGIDQFQLEGKTFDMSDLLQRFSPELKQAQNAGCIQSIRVIPGANISTRDYVQARNALGQHFYPADRPAN